MLASPLSLPFPTSSSFSSSSPLPRPLYLKIQKVVIALGDYLDAQCHACIGGTNVRADIAKLEIGQHIVVGTPGRVFDMISRRALGGWPCDDALSCTLLLSLFCVPPHTHTHTCLWSDPRHIRIFVLDEADEMLSRGFKDQIYDVFRKMPSNTQVSALSEDRQNIVIC